MDLLIIFIVTAVMGALLTRLALKLNIIDIPNYRKIHSTAVPKAGGIGVIIPVLCILIWNGIKLHTAFSNEEAAIIISTFFLFIVGIFDDKLELSAKRKLLFQTLAAVITVSLGVCFQLTNDYFINYFITVFWIVGFTNAMNLIDGLDGLAGGIGLITSAGILIFAMKYLANRDAVSAAALMGSLIGFLYWNRHPAKIFMGDTGSLPLGYLLAVLIVHTGNTIGGFGGTAVALFMVAIPIYDTALSIIRRKLNGRPIFAPDRSHFYNLLMDQKGFSYKNTVRLIYIFNICLVIVALTLEHILPIYRYALAIILVVAAILGSLKAGFLKVDDKR